MTMLPPSAQMPAYYELPAERRAKAEQALREIRASRRMMPSVAMEKLWNILVHPDVYEPTL